MTETLRKGGAAILTLSLLVFTTAILIAWGRGLDITCGCFGSESAINYPVKVAQNAGLILVGAVLWWGTPTKSLKKNSRGRQREGEEEPGRPRGE